MNTQSARSFLEKKSMELFGIEFETQVKLVSNQGMLDYQNSILKEGKYAKTSIFFANVSAHRKNGEIHVRNIMINEITLKYLTREEIEKILLHELTHYALIKKGSNESKDGDAEFEKTVLEIGSFGKTCSFLPEIYERVTQILKNNRTAPY